MKLTDSKISALYLDDSIKEENHKILNDHSREIPTTTTTTSSVEVSVSLRSTAIGGDLQGHEEGGVDSSRSIVHQNTALGDETKPITLLDSSDTSSRVDNIGAAPLLISPPPIAFQNLPMMSRGGGFASIKPLSSGDSDNTFSEASKLATKPEVVDAVSVPSPSASQQHLVVADEHNNKSIGMLQLPFHRYPPSLQSFSSDEESANIIQHSTLLKRAHIYGDSSGVGDDGNAASTMIKNTERSRQDAAILTHIAPKYQRRMSKDSSVSLSDISLESSEDPYRSQGVFARNMPKPSADGAAEGDRPAITTPTATELLLSGDFNHESQNELVMNESYKTPATKDVVVTVPIVIDSSDDSISCSNGSGYDDNESNTSSVSESLPLADANRSSQQEGGASGAKEGILGNRASSRRAKMVCCDRADDEFSTGSENSILMGKFPHRREQDNHEHHDKPSSSSSSSSSLKKSIHESITTMPGLSRNRIDGPFINRHNAEYFSSSVGAGTDDFYINHTDDDDFLAPSAPFSTERHPDHLPQTQVSSENLSMPPTHHISLFESFDRNWAQATQGEGSGAIPSDVRELGMKCFAAFAVVFGSCRDYFSGLPFLETKPFRWWVDDEYSIDSVSRKESTNGDQEERHQGIPIAVIRFLWKTCFLDPYSHEKAETVLDSIQHTLVKQLCFLSEVKTPSASCLRLSLDVYAEYGRYILRRYTMQGQVAKWHSKFALALRRLLLDSKLADAKSMTKKRYAALSLPRHTAIGLLDVDANGHSLLILDDDKVAHLRTQLFDNLLSDKYFINARSNLLGRDAFQHTSSGQISTQISGKNDWNLFVSTNQHMRDIEWCSSLIGYYLNKENDLPFQQAKNVRDYASILSSCCLDAISGWQAELISLFQTLFTSGKLTICEYNADEPDSIIGTRGIKVPDAKPDQCAVGEGDSQGQDTVKVAESLLMRNDAWIMEDNSAKIFQRVSPKTFPRPRRGRRQKETSATSALARILSIDINELRTSISIGRSLIALAEFSHTMLDQCNYTKDRNESIPVNSQVHLMQRLCLQYAIEALSCSATTLTYILCNSLDNLDEDDLDDTVVTTLGPAALLHRFSSTREDSKVLLYVASILLAEGWYFFGRLVIKLTGSGSSDVALSILDRALCVLNFPKSLSLKTRTVEDICQSVSARHKYFLQSNIMHSTGVYLYEQGDIDRADEFLNKASILRRQILEDLRRYDSDTGDDIKGSLSEVFNAIVGGMKNRPFLSSTPMNEETFKTTMVNSISQTCILLPRTQFTVDELESSLSLTLEYLALARHAKQKYQSALALFQESLILRDIHVGKHSLDVASLHFNMGVVYDDLEQYDQAISRYHESIRIRLNQRNKATSVDVISDLEDSLITTLRCMGDVYRTISDEDNAICCYINALEMSHKKLRSSRDLEDEFEIMGLQLGLAVPVPTLVFDDVKSSGWVTHFQMMNKRDLCHVFEQVDKRQGWDLKLKKKITKMHSTVIKLILSRNKATLKCGMPALSSLLASISSTFMSGCNAFEIALVRSSYFMGKVKLEQTRYEEAADYFEAALRSKWRLDPASSSDSDSDFSRKSKSRKQLGRLLDEDNPEEGQIYYALGICNSALDDHERSVRCFLTALRYLRRSLRKVDSLEVARVLFDCATSYYYLCNFEQSASYYTECLRILTSSDSSVVNEDDNTPNPTKINVSKSGCFRRGVVLYCLTAAKIAISVDLEASKLLAEARVRLSECGDNELLAYTRFLQCRINLHDLERIPVRMKSITRIFPTDLGTKRGLSWNEMCNILLTYLDQVLDVCWFDPTDEITMSDKVKHLPLSGHICFEKGRIYELMDSIDKALKCFADAAYFYRMACGDENVYLCHALQKMGMICSQGREHDALGYFNEALSLRKRILGGEDIAVAETLYFSALVLARMNRYEASMERFNEALRIQMNFEKDSHEVARTLAEMGRCHYTHRAYPLAMPCLEGSIKIRKYRISESAPSKKTIDVCGEEVALAECFFALGNLHMQLKDQAQAMRFYIQARDIRWRHLGSGTVDSIVGRYLSGMLIDEDELMGLAHCLHNIGVIFDNKNEYQRSIPHYEEALAIKNAIAGIPADDSRYLGDNINSDVIRAMVIQALDEDNLILINKTTLSASVTHQRLAMVYVNQQKYGDALFHFLKALRIQRRVLGKEHSWVGVLLSSMGNALRFMSTDSETAIICYDESLRISRLRAGQNHDAAASTMYNIGSLHESNRNFTKAMYYYQRALSAHKQRYSHELRQRLCSGLIMPRTLLEGPESIDILNTGEIVHDTSPPREQQIQEQYALVKEALRKAKRRDKINRGERLNCVGDTEDMWLNLESLIFRFVEMLSLYVVEPASITMRETIHGARNAIASAAAHAVISASDALDYQFLLLLQE